MEQTTIPQKLTEKELAELQEKQLETLLNNSKSLSRTVHSVQSARTAISKRISELIKEFEVVSPNKGEELATQFIGQLLVSLDNTLKVKDKSDVKEQGKKWAVVAIRIIDKYKYFKVSDLVYVFNKISDGEIKIYGALNRQDIMGALHEHDKLRSMR